MNVWFAVPSKRRLESTRPVFAEWARTGYKVAVMIDPGDPEPDVDMVIRAPYAGYSRSVNALAHAILRHDGAAQWIVTGGDDTYPDRTKEAQDIAIECYEHFGKST